ncbi:hypothetical protein SEUCBS139899_001504 [Sporothrix eucalyptigena]
MSIDLGTLLESLPACKRCRKNRRRCDTKLPSCANCNKAGVECIFYDHALQEELPRSYIASLVEHLSRDDTDTTTPALMPCNDAHRPTTNARHDHHFAYAQGAYRYLGAGSHLLDVRIRGRPNYRPPPPHPRQRPPLPLSADNPIPHELRMYLTQLFFDTIHQVYPILDPSSPWLLSEDVTTPSQPPTQAFVREMVCAVACHCERSDTSSGQSLAPLAVAAHARALRHIEQATAAQAVSTLQVVVLLVLYTLVRPATGGNISQQLGFAIRLVIDLCESGSDGESEGEGHGDGPERQERQSPPLASLYKVIYCLENHVCGVLVRPTALPEPKEPLVIPSFSSFMSSSSESPSLDLLCTLYRVQAHCRNGRIDSKDGLRTSVPAFADEYQRRQQQDDPSVLHHNVAAVLGETCLVLSPASIDAAVMLLDAYSNPAFLATFASAYWVHRAGNVITDAVLTGKEEETAKTGTNQSHLIRAYGQAIALLQSWAGTWDAAGVLRQALEQRLEGGS